MARQVLSAVAVPAGALERLTPTTMKIPLNPRRNHGLTIVMIIMLLLLIMAFVGTIAYVVIKAIERLQKKLPNDEDESAIVQQVVEEELAALRLEHPGETVTLGSFTASYVYVPITNFSVQSSTNLIDWVEEPTLRWHSDYTLPIGATTGEPMRFYRKVVVW